MNPYTASMTEKALQEAIRQACVAHKWLYYHTHRSQHSPAGFPDVVALKGPRMLVAELKRSGKKVTPAQWEWLDAFQQVHTVERYIWYPDELNTALAIIGGQ